MRILLLHKYGQKAASFRYRLQQYVPYLEAAGFECTVSPLLGDDYLTERFKSGRRSPLAIAQAALRRLKVLYEVERYDLVVLCIEVFPYVPALFERYLNFRGVPYVFDYDDPIFHYYDLSHSRTVKWLLGNKMKQVVRGASVVFGGSPYLVDYARAQNADVELLPTVVDLKKYHQTKKFETPARSGGQPFVLGWIGSPSTAAYLTALAPALREFCARHAGARLVCVGSGPLSIPGVPVEIREWTDATEVSDILDFDVGLMPLTDDPWSRGKCGFKLIQYMACGVPALASPVGVNSTIVEEGLSGFLPRTQAEWVAALERLIGNPQLLAKMGARGRQRVEERYCLAVTAPRFVAGVQRALKRNEKSEHHGT
jgi:glycosyltransferase involved in cell wall biosynthesis